MGDEINNPTPWWVIYMLVEFDKRGHKYKAADLTCKKCGAVDTCVYAWDIYNMHGDCLASK